MIGKKCKQKIHGTQSYTIDDAVSDVGMYMLIAKTVDTVWIFKKEYWWSLNNNGYSELPIVRPQVISEHFPKRLKSYFLH